MICRKHGDGCTLTPFTGICIDALANDGPLGPTAIAMHFGVTQSRILQIEARALKKLARAIGRRRLDLMPLVAEGFGAPVRRYGAAQ